ncbi:MAG: hypothetical protein KGL31_13225 [candidate division NC10 bacterium]|nr:hypothetical protein [candidate division NC10 bacterium]
MPFSKTTLAGFIIAVFLGGFVLGRLSIAPVHAQGLVSPLTAKITQLGSLIEQMQKNIDEVQGNLKALRAVKESLAAGARTEGGLRMLQEVPKLPAPAR